VEGGESCLIFIRYKSSDVNLRHGALLAISGIITALTDLKIEISLDLQLQLR
jgi:hypothetical protein